MKNPLFSLSIIVFSIFSPTIIFVTDADCFPLPLNGMTNNAPLELHIFSRFEVSPHEVRFFFGAPISTELKLEMALENSRSKFNGTERRSRLDSLNESICIRSNWKRSGCVKLNQCTNRFDDIHSGRFSIIKMERTRMNEFQWKDSPRRQSYRSFYAGVQ